MLEALTRAWRTARGAYLGEGLCGLSTAAMLLVMVGGGAAALLAIGVVLALEPVK